MKNSHNFLVKINVLLNTFNTYSAGRMLSESTVTSPICWITMKNQMCGLNAWLPKWVLDIACACIIFVTMHFIVYITAHIHLVLLSFHAGNVWIFLWHSWFCLFLTIDEISCSCRKVWWNKRWVHYHFNSVANINCLMGI